MTWPGVLGLDELHCYLPGWVEAVASNFPLSNVYPTRHSANNVQTPVGMFEKRATTSIPADTYLLRSCVRRNTTTQVPGG